MITALLVVFWAWALWVLFLAYSALRPSWKEHSFRNMRTLPRYAAWATLIVALVVDVLFNIVVGTVIFLELPHYRRLTLTMRCKRWMDDPGYRGYIARCLARDWLNPFDPGHL